MGWICWKTSRKTIQKSKTSRKTTQKSEEIGGKEQKPKEEDEQTDQNETKLTRREAKTMERLQQDGVIILIDQPNLEIGMQDKMEDRCGQDVFWTICYEELVKIIQRKVSTPEEAKVLETFLVTSPQFRQRAVYKHEKDKLRKHNIKLLVSPVKPRGRGGEKSTDCMLVRKMVEEFTGIEMLRLQGKKAGKRTFCILAGDGDYIDVAKTAVEKGFDVELWYWCEPPVHKSVNTQWKEVEEKYQGDWCRKCGVLRIKELSKEHRRRVTLWHKKCEVSCESEVETLC